MRHLFDVEPTAAAIPICGSLEGRVYVLSDPQRIANGCRCMYAALGWDEQVPFEVVLPFGSKVVPHEECVAAVHACLRGRAAATLPGRRYTLDSLVHHHNHYATLTAWLLAFCVGVREAIAFDFMARTCRPAVVALLTGACLRIADVWHVHMFGRGLRRRHHRRDRSASRRRDWKVTLRTQTG